jgi:hypothetical protein
LKFAASESTQPLCTHLLRGVSVEVSVGMAVGMTVGLSAEMHALHRGRERAVPARHRGAVHDERKVRADLSSQRDKCQDLIRPRRASTGCQDPVCPLPHKCIHGILASAFMASAVYGPGCHAGASPRRTHAPSRPAAAPRVCVALRAVIVAPNQPSPNCPGREPPFSAVKRPARPYKTAIQNRFT